VVHVLDVGQEMKRNVLALVIGILTIGGVSFLARSTDERTEVNAMTGAVRTKMRYAYVFNTAWKVRPTWVEESAARQGISTDGGWQYLSVVSTRLLYTLNECGRAPVSYPMQVVDPEELNLKTAEEIDRFARDFIAADESKRARMILMP
jgi:hypothetical protein